MQKVFTKEMMVKAFRDNGWKETLFRLADGTVAVVTPFYFGNMDEDDIELSDIEYFLVDCEGLPYMGGDTVDAVVKNFNNILNLRDAEKASKQRIRAFFDKHQKDGWDEDSWGFYSDWHKNIYGYRPHGYVCGVYVNPHTM